MSFLPKFFGKRVIVTVHGLDWQREKWKSGFGAKYIRWGEKMAARFADEIIVLSRNVQDYFLREYGRTTHFIPNGVAKPEKCTPDQIVLQFGLQGDDYVLFLGRLVPEKGVHYLIDAYNQIKTDKKLVIAGDTSDTDDYVALLKQKALNNPNIIFTGFISGDELCEMYPQEYGVWCNDIGKAVCPNGESVKAFSERIDAILTETLSASSLSFSKFFLLP